MKEIDEYISNLTAERQVAIQKLRQVINSNLPEGFIEIFGYGMIAYIIPHSMYPDGYHCDPKLPLPFINLASQKNFIALYHMGIYASPELMGWFQKEYPKYVKTKLDMGKSCIRFKKIETIPYDLIGALIQKMTPEDWIDLYEKNFKR